MTIVLSVWGAASPVFQADISSNKAKTTLDFSLMGGGGAGERDEIRSSRSDERLTAAYACQSRKSPVFDHSILRHIVI